jgi:hypothetical protein
MIISSLYHWFYLILSCLNLQLQLKAMSSLSSEVHDADKVGVA